MLRARCRGVVFHRCEWWWEHGCPHSAWTGPRGASSSASSASRPSPPGALKLTCQNVCCIFLKNYGRRACGLEPDSGRSRPGWRRTFFFLFLSEKKIILLFFWGQVLSARQNGGGGCLVRASPATPAARQGRLKPTCFVWA